MEEASFKKQISLPVGDLHTPTGILGILELVPPPSIERMRLLGLTRAPGITRALVTSLDIRLEPQNAAEKLTHILGLAVTIFDRANAPGMDPGKQI